VSYNGYSQFLCKHGHQWTKDCYELDWTDEKDYPKCPVCGEPHVWENMVNLTNGSFDKEGNRIDGYVELKPLQINKVICANCGDEHVCRCSTYEIPPDIDLSKQKIAGDDKQESEGGIKK